MSRRSDYMDDLWLVELYVDVYPNMTDPEQLIVSRYDKYVGAKMPGAKRYITTLYIPKPDNMKIDRRMIQEIKEEGVDK